MKLIKLADRDRKRMAYGYVSDDMASGSEDKKRKNRTKLSASATLE